MCENAFFRARSLFSNILSCLLMCMICVFDRQKYIDIKYVEQEHGNKYFMVVNRTAVRMQGVRTTVFCIYIRLKGIGIKSR